MSDLRVAVVGVGHHGRHHARIMSQLPGVVLAGVVDSHEMAARAIAESLGTTAYPCVDDVLDSIDAACVAVPTIHHFQVASKLLSRGIATLVEKPLTFDPLEASELVEIARQKRAVLMPGHVERFNPAWSAFSDSGIRPNFIEATRMSRYPFRSLDVSVVFDVMIHDIDLVLSATNARVRDLQVLGGRVLSPSADWAEVRLELDNGAVAHLSASRVHHDTERRIRLAGEGASIEIDLFKRSSVVQRRRDVVVDDCLARLGSHPTPQDKETLLNEMFVLQSTAHDRTAEPLRRELEEFVACIRENRQPLVTAEHGLEAVRTAHDIERSLRLGGKGASRRHSA